MEWIGDEEEISTAVWCVRVCSTLCSGKMAEGGEFLKTQKDKEFFVHENHLYTFNSHSKRDPDLHFYVCAERKICKGRIHVKNGEFVKEVTPHTHLADAAKVQAKRAIGYCKEQAASSQDATSKILQDGLGTQSQAVAGALPSLPAMKRMIQRQRNAAQNVPPDPKTAEAFIIPEEYKFVRIFEREEDFLHFDKTEEGRRIVIFTTKKNLELLVRVKFLGVIVFTFAVIATNFASAAVGERGKTFIFYAF